MPRSVQIVLWLALCAGVRAQVVDRVVANAGKYVVTLSDVQREQRMACYLNDGPPKLTTPEEIRAMAGKLADRILIKREMDSGIFVPGPKEEFDSIVIAARARFKSEDLYRAALARCGVSEQEVIAYLALQSRIYDFIDFRVLPGMQITAKEIQDFYDKELVPAWAKRGEKSQTLDVVRDNITALLRERLVNERLDAWLKELHNQTEVRIR